jgi:hypothetical protein
MTPSEQVGPKRVSIMARLIPLSSYGLPAFGAAVSAWLFIGVMEAMRHAEAAGIAAVAGGMSEATLAIVVTLYLAILVGFAGLIIGVFRVFSNTTTASPSGWFYLVAALIGLAPTVTLWQAESILIEVLIGGTQTGVAGVASQITICLMLTLGLAVIGGLILLVASVVPLPAFMKAKRKWSPAVWLLIMELALILLTVAYHMRTYWFYQVRINERF